jgi:hypothetical protein
MLFFSGENLERNEEYDMKKRTFELNYVRRTQNFGYVINYAITFSAFWRPFTIASVEASFELKSR